MIPEEEMHACKAWLQSIHVMEKEEEDLNEWLHHNLSDLKDLLQNRKLARELKESQFKGTTGPYKYKLKEHRDMKTAIDGWTVTINKLKVVKEKRSKRELH